MQVVAVDLVDGRVAGIEVAADVPITGTDGAHICTMSPSSPAAPPFSVGRERAIVSTRGEKDPGASADRARLWTPTVIGRCG